MDEWVEKLLDSVRICPVCGGPLGRILFPERIDEKYCPHKLCGYFSVIAGYLVFKTKEAGF